MDAYRFRHRSEVFSHFLARYAWWQGVRSNYPRPRPLRYPVASVYGGGGPWHFRGELFQARIIRFVDSELLQVYDMQNVA